MERQAIFRRPPAGMFLVLVAGLFFSSCVFSKPVIVTTITVDGCKASYENNNCGGAGNAGDICVAKGPNTKVDLRFVFTVGGQDAEFTKVEVSRVPPGKPCPDWASEDFPQFTNCIYSPAGVGNVLLIEDDNHHEAEWDYSITVDLHDDDCPDPVVIDPLIRNGGNN